MTMVPSQNGKHQQKRSTNYSFYAASAMNQVVEVEGYNNYNNCLLGSDFVVRHMAEDESRANTNSTTHNDAEAEAEAGSTSKEEERGINNNSNDNSSNWLQLSIGFHHQGDRDSSAKTTTKQDYDDDDDHHQAGSIMAPTGSGSLVELELLPGGRHLNWGSSSRPSLEPQAMFPLGSSEVRGSARGSSFGGSLLFEQQTSMSMSMACGPISAPTFGHNQQQQQQHHPQEMANWAFGPLPQSMAVMPSPSFVSSSSSPSQSCSSLRPPPPPPPPIGSYFPTPFHFPSSGFDQFDVAGPSSDVTVRVVDPPRRSHSGIWFMLQASQNQAKEPFLPQIPKSYLRIKDGRMTVRLLLKYLVSKLRLESESEIEITCRGQKLLPFLTLQHVRDNIWTPRDTTTRTLLSDSSTTDHVMVLHYGRGTS